MITREYYIVRVNSSCTSLFRRVSIDNEPPGLSVLEGVIRHHNGSWGFWACYEDDVVHKLNREEVIAYEMFGVSGIRRLLTNESA